ncbi:hypothetical protein GQ44DRAFT_758744 [Phaeosphaeriaceae sp. PMI808]|nr:hypothetical protein GQ44DRAFT_758744 [Phaeosphaeriaceae sp. PMI808]
MQTTKFCRPGTPFEYRFGYVWPGHEYIDSPSSSEEERMDKLKMHRHASFPHYQFWGQVRIENESIIKAHADGTCRVPFGEETMMLATNNVRERWKEQGIWDDTWGLDDVGWQWKHEEMVPLDIFGPCPDIPGKMFSFEYEKSDEEIKMIAEQVTLERRRSRPIWQFEYQVSQASARIRDQIGLIGLIVDKSADSSKDVDTMAYEEVKRSWIKQHIWDDEWDRLPGRHWMHEWVSEELFAALFILSKPENPDATSMHGQYAKVIRTMTARY